MNTCTTQEPPATHLAIAHPIVGVPVTAANDPAFGLDRGHALARCMGYLTETDICDLYQVTEGTVETWRKRGLGPRHIMAGNRPLYAIEEVSDDLKSRLRAKKTVPAKDML